MTRHIGNGQDLKKVNNERLRVMQFFRFQKAADGTYFAAIAPIYNVLPLVLPYAQDRFADQQWLIYDLKESMDIIMILTIR